MFITLFMIFVTKNAKGLLNYIFRLNLKSININHIIMKKITIILLLFLFGIATGYSQVLVGEGTNTEQVLPINAYYGYTYSQSIYLSSEINASGTITTLQWYYTGTGNLANNQSIVIYFGQTDKTSFDSDADFIGVEDLTQVYSGGIVTNSTPGWKTITLSTPFVYNNASNLVIAVDENMEEYDESDDDFYNTAVSGQRSIYAFSGTTNIDPLDPTNDGTGDFIDVERGTTAFVPNIILGGIQQACPNPSGVTLTNVTVTNATATWTAAVGQTNWEAIIQETYMDVPLATQSGIAVTGTPTYTRTDLMPNTMYTTYVRAICADPLKSGWVASQNFYTLCVFSGDFVQDFNSTAYGEIPNCWSSLNLSDNEYAYVQTVDYNGSLDSNCIEFYNSGDATAPLYLITPGLTSIGSNTHRIKFKAKSPGGYSLVFGTMSDPTDATTFTALNTYTLNSEYTDFSYTFNNTTTDDFIAFKHGGSSTYTYVIIDDIVWEPIPSQVPDCLTDLNVTTDEGCGNFPNLFEWSAASGADGYYVSIGTSVNGGDLVVNNANVYSALTYSFSGNPATTYYYKVTPYNALGAAINCFEDSFTTYDDGCYCISVPEDFDGSGITSVQINDSEFTNEPIAYYDFSEDETVNISQGVITSLNISFATGYSYYANVWIDYNDNFTFEPNEIVFSGVSANTGTSVLNASFLTVLNANLGLHKMRIGTTSFNQTPANPCYNSYGGITFDFMVNVLPAPACLPPSASTVTSILANSAQVNWVSGATLFNIEYGYAPFLQGSGTLVSGITANMTMLNNLEAQTNYSYYLQSSCGTDGLSPWVGPFTFRTACDAFGDFTEDFTTEDTVDAPECWATIVNTTSQYPYIEIYEGNDSVEIYNSDDENAELYLITPVLSDLALGNHRVKFKASSYSEGVSVIVGTMSDINNASTFTSVQTIPLSFSTEEFVVAFNSTTDTHVAFKFVGTDSYQGVMIDDFVWQPIPTVAPSCASDINVATNTECGNFASLFTWSEVPGADFYKLTIGTTSGTGTTINIGNVTSYAFEGNFGTTYFYTLVPENSFGPATGCVEGTFTTFSEGCYCEAISEGNMDGDGITNLTVGNESFEIPLLSYIDLTEDEDAVVVVQGQTSSVAITFETGFTYNSHVWVDWNDNYTFEPSEKMFTGESDNDIPFVLDASFMVPATAPLGVHRMRIGTADGGQETPNPCYSDSYGITIDLNILVQDSLGTVGFDKNTFNVYPNPVKDVLNVSFTQNISNVAVYNLLGQEVLVKKMNDNKGQVDMSSLPIGTYLVKVNTENAVKTIKVIKE